MSRAVAFSSLPDQVLVHIFSSIELKDRHRTLALVCKGWHRLVHSPELLQELTIYIGSQGVVARSLRLCQWLVQRAAGYVEQLDLVLSEYSEASDEDARDLLAALAGSLAACDSTGRLAKLRLDVNVDNQLSMSSWLLLSLRHVRCLHLYIEWPVCITTQLSSLTALEELELSGGLHLSTDASLPPSLTKLSIGRNCGDLCPELPHQLSSLPNLRCLHLHDFGFGEGTYVPLSQLRQLTELKLWNSVSPGGAILAALTSLQRLVILGAADDDYTALGGSLANLQQLTSFIVQCGERCHTLPTGLSQLSRLRCFCWDNDFGQPFVLPPGPWLANLQQLAAPAASVAGNLRALEAAQQLTCLCMYSQGTRPLDSHPLPENAVLQWAARHAALLKVRLARYGTNLPSRLFDAALQAQARRPSLCIERINPGWEEPEGLLDGA